ncbi:TetR/AcrR family transcriptional regulator [Sphingomonas sp. CGMCC 1.13654]|uniref:TetR/AcrR family transcriptional regulator n=1 Tax=Sphingomonas chungangi TaxID=2683589 RepID=A0A838L381_9SPHN|nr:TetR/AcrR family transcriptional regulator [Sphingomonas chungangi]MBA2933851.1 TetR/AcrR family transcriptional regulator [Sphingomonas chungangi]MVW55181.1 TetR family transcriptional regulator [Sphingomonas chungangi]
MYRATDIDEASTGERVLAAAHACFERYGVPKTTIEDIARETGVSRPTVYKYHNGKDAILEELSRREVLKVNAEVRAGLVRREGFADFLTEALFLVIRIAGGNAYIRRLLEAHDFQLAAMDPASAMFRMQRDWWRGPLAHAAERGELAPDLDTDEIVTWLGHSQRMLLVHAENSAVDDVALRRMIRRFVVAPLLA